MIALLSGMLLPSMPSHSLRKPDVPRTPLSDYHAPPQGVGMSGAIHFVGEVRPNQYTLFSLVLPTATILNCAVQHKIPSSFMAPWHYWCAWPSACPARFTSHILLSTPGYKASDCVPVMSLFTLPPLPREWTRHNSLEILRPPHLSIRKPLVPQGRLPTILASQGQQTSTNTNPVKP